MRSPGPRTRRRGRRAQVEGQWKTGLGLRRGTTDPNPCLGTSSRPGRNKPECGAGPGDVAGTRERERCASDSWLIYRPRVVVHSGLRSPELPGRHTALSGSSGVPRNHLPSPDEIPIRSRGDRGRGTQDSGLTGNRSSHPGSRWSSVLSRCRLLGHLPDPKILRRGAHVKSLRRVGVLDPVRGRSSEPKIPLV